MQILMDITIGVLVYDAEVLLEYASKSCEQAWKPILDTKCSLAGRSRKRCRDSDCSRVRICSFLVLWHLRRRSPCILLQALASAGQLHGVLTALPAGLGALKALLHDSARRHAIRED